MMRVTEPDMLPIGRSGISVPFLGMGTWAIGGGTWWGDNDDEVSIAAIRKAVDCGVTWIDTAPIYGLYHSEEVVGRALQGIRSKVVLSTKCGLQWRHPTSMPHKTVDGTQVYRDLSKASIMQDAEDSLRRLHTDCIDVLYTHWQTTDLSVYPLEDTMDAFYTLKKQGKIRAIGASNVTPDMLRRYIALGGLDVIQEKYSVLTRRIEEELLPLCHENGISLQAYSPLEQGLLTGKVTMESVYPPGDTRSGNPQFRPENRKKALELLKAWQPLCGAYGCRMGNLVIAYTARRGYPVHILAGARTPEQAEDNSRALSVRLSDEDVSSMTAALESILM